MANIFDQHFPEELCGVDIEGVDVQMLALDALRLLSYFSRESDFTKEQYAVLREIESDLPKVIQGVEEKQKAFFKKLEHAVKEAHRVYHQNAHKE